MIQTAALPALAPPVIDLANPGELTENTQDSSLFASILQASLPEIQTAGGAGATYGLLATYSPGEPASGNANGKILPLVLPVGVPDRLAHIQSDSLPVQPETVKPQLPDLVPSAAIIAQGSPVSSPRKASQSEIPNDSEPQTEILSDAEPEAGTDSEMHSGELPDSLVLLTSGPDRSSLPVTVLPEQVASARPAPSTALQAVGTGTMPAKPCGQPTQKKSQPQSQPQRQLVTNTPDPLTLIVADLTFVSNKPPIAPTRPDSQPITTGKPTDVAALANEVIDQQATAIKQATDPATPIDRNTIQGAPSIAMMPGQTAPAQTVIQSQVTSTKGDTKSHDFSTLVDRLVEARQIALAGQSHQSVQTMIRHAEFGAVSLRFETRADALSVSLSSPDPEFNRAVLAAAPAPSGSNTGSGQDAFHQGFSGTPGGSPQGQSQHRGQAARQSDPFARHEQDAQPHYANDIGDPGQGGIFA